MPVLAEMGRLLVLAALDTESSEVVGGGTLHQLDAERAIVEIGTSCSLTHVGVASRPRSHGCSPSTCSRSASYE
jgi:hypothetical protein